MANAIVSLKNVNKSYGKNQIVYDMSLDVYEGEFLTLLGPSGCGKTTTLRMISGFETVSSGCIFLEGESVEHKEPYHRNVNTVFQDYALFPHMNIFDNIAYGLKIKKMPSTEIRKKVMEMLDLVQLTGFEKRRPNEMSGGQRQRVAIARALVNEPKVLLLDEPLGALDMKLRRQMQVELKSLQRKLDVTFIYVTHDQEEALMMSDRIAIMNNGHLEQISMPHEIYARPKTRFVAEFIGESNIFCGTVTGVAGSLVTARTPAGMLIVQAENYEVGNRISICIRPENFQFSDKPVEGFDFSGTVKELFYVGSQVKIIIQLKNGSECRLCCFSEGALPLAGQKVYLSWKPSGAVVVGGDIYGKQKQT